MAFIVSVFISHVRPLVRTLQFLYSSVCLWLCLRLKACISALDFQCNPFSKILRAHKVQQFIGFTLVPVSWENGFKKAINLPSTRMEIDSILMHLASGHVPIFFNKRNSLHLTLFIRGQ